MNHPLLTLAVLIVLLDFIGDYAEWRSRHRVSRARLLAVRGSLN